MRMRQSSLVRIGYYFPSLAMRYDDYELAEQIMHLPVKQKPGKKQRQLSQKGKPVKPVCLKFS